jgi:hypothetical protein
MSDDPFDVANCILTPEQVAELAPLQKKSEAGKSSRPGTRGRRKATKMSRRRPETWAKIPHRQGFELAKRAGNPMLAVLLALEVAIYAAHSNRIKLTNGLLRRYRITPQSKTRGLRQLVAAGVVSVEQSGFVAPFVTHHWYTKKGVLRKSRP